MTAPHVEYLRVCFVYDPASGELKWKSRPLEHFVDARAFTIWNSRWAGKTIGTDSHGYRKVCLDYQLYPVHRLIWKMMTGEDPPETLDHIDGNKANNRWTNLRLATMAEQGWNVGRRKHNTSGRRGVGPARWGRWRARIVVNGTLRHLGTFTEVEEASRAYEVAASELHGAFYRSQQGGKL